MDVRDLIDQAKAVSGLTLGQMAAEMHIAQSKFTAWKKGEYNPGPGEIAYLAEKAGLPVLETVAEIEASFNEHFAPIWQAALGKLRAAGVAATVTLGLATSLMMAPSESHARILIDGSKTSVSAKAWKPRRSLDRRGFFLARQ